MPKQKIEVNENLNVSIGDLLKSITTENDNPLKANEEMAYTENRAEVSDAKVSENPPSKNDAKTLKTNTLHDSDIKKVIPKLGKISFQHQRAGRGGKDGNFDIHIRRNLV